jgi:hypothetical protein
MTPIPDLAFLPDFVHWSGRNEGTMPEKDEETLKAESIARVEHVHKHVMQVLAGEIPKDAPRGLRPHGRDEAVGQALVVGTGLQAHSGAVGCCR